MSLPTGSAYPAGSTSATTATSTTADPPGVLRVDLAVTDRLGREFLARELTALADLKAAHLEEFRQAIKDEAVLAVPGQGDYSPASIPRPVIARA